MCGLFASFSRAGPVTEDYTRELTMLAHRGPDGWGTERISLNSGSDAQDRAWLGHRRLSIIDPDPRANQPMDTADGRYSVVYNGEIYNYLELRQECLAAGWQFRTGSDTEVLLACWALWGPAAAARFEGMFALVLVDRQDGVAWLARDAFGIKPLHYALTGDRLLVSSEIPPLLATRRVPFAVDPQSAAEFIRFGASSDLETTLIPSIRRLPAASVARFDFSTGTLETPRTFWRPATQASRQSFPDAVAECRERFLTNVRLHLRSDVPVGAALSGGIDSSAIVCAISHLQPDFTLDTFSFLSAEPGQSEEKWVDIVNRHVDARAHLVRPAPDDLAQDLDAMIDAQGEPFGSASIYAQFRVFQSARAAGVPVTLDGQGADEILAGYWPYAGTHGAALLRRGRIDRALRLALRGGEDRRTRVWIAGQIAQSALPTALKLRLRKLLGRAVLPEFLDRDALSAAGVREGDLAEQAIGSYGSMRDHLVDSALRTSLPTLLRIADRSSMAHSIESRVPFLTPAFADFLFALPPEYLLSPDGTRKHVFREAMRGILPEPIRTRRDKIGFFADDGLWLRANWLHFEPGMEELDRIAAIDAPAARRYVDRFRAAGEGSAQQVWRIAIFGLWHRRMRALAA